MSKPPARGVKAGIQADLQAAKDAGAGYVAGPGTTAWSHDFLNKKPWHPLNFKNQMRKYEAEQDVELRSKREEAAKAEFESEQRYLDTLAHLPSTEADKYRQRQSVSWMYLKPPGLSAWEEKEKQQKADQGKPQEAEKDRPVYLTDAGRAAAKSGMPLSRPSGSGASGGGHDVQGWNLNLKRKERSPPRGGFDWADDNQQFVGTAEADELPSVATVADSPRRTSKRHKGAKESKLHKDVKKKHKEKASKEDKRKDKELRRALKVLLKEGVQVEDIIAPAQEGAGRLATEPADTDEPET